MTEAGRTAVLLDELDRARLDSTVVALADLLLQRDPAVLGGPAVRSRLRAMAAAPRGTVRAAAIAAGLRGGDESLVEGTDGADLVAAMDLCAPGDGPMVGRAAARLRRDVVLGRAPVLGGVAAVVRHGAAADDGRADVIAWLGRLIEKGGRLGMDRWGPSHDLAMAALRELHRMPRDQWPAALRRHAQPVITARAIDRGRAIYHDEAVGCIRCHGADGQGLEGYPGLAGSPWLLADPRIAAGIVVHGLYGPLRMPDGSRFNSVMAPLGENLDDEEIAAALTWARQAWGNFAPPVSAEMVAEARATTPTGGAMWTVASLEATWPKGRTSLLGPIEPDRVVLASGSIEAGADGARPSAPRGRAVDPSRRVLRDLLVMTAAVVVGLVAIGVLAHRSRGA